jgi:hypothetical protein
MEHVSCCTRMEGQNASTRHASAKAALIEVCRESAVSVDAHEPREYASVTCPACGSDVADAQWKTHSAACPAFRASPEGIRHRSGPDVRYYVGGATVTVDFTVLGLGCPSKVSRPVAALVKEVCSKKHEKYAKACADRGEEFVVFAATSHGHLFAETERQIRRITGHVGATAAEALSRVSTAVIRGTAAALLNAERVAGIAPPTKEERQARETRRLQLLAEPASQLLSMRADDLLSAHADVQRDLLAVSAALLPQLFASICTRSAPNLELFQLAWCALRGEERESRERVLADEAAAQDRLSRTLEDGWRFVGRMRSARAATDLLVREANDRADLEDGWFHGALTVVSGCERRCAEAVSDAADRRALLADMTGVFHMVNDLRGRQSDPAHLRQQLDRFGAMPTEQLRASSIRTRMAAELEVQERTTRSEVNALVGRISAVMPLTADDVVELGNESRESLRDVLQSMAKDGENAQTVATICRNCRVVANPPALEPCFRPPRSSHLDASASSIASRLVSRQTTLSALRPSRPTADDRAPVQQAAPRTPRDAGPPHDARTSRDTTTLDFWRLSEVLAPVAPVSVPVTPAATPRSVPVTPVATPPSVPVTPVATPRSVPVTPVATPRSAQVTPSHDGPNRAAASPVVAAIEDFCFPPLEQLPRSPAALPRDRPHRLTTATALPGSPRASAAPAPRGSVAAARR